MRRSAVDTVSHLLVMASFGKLTDRYTSVFELFCFVSIAAGALVLHSKHVAAVIVPLFCLTEQNIATAFDHEHTDELI